MLVGILTLVAVGGITDLLLDRPERWLSVHVAFELGLIVFSLAMATVLWVGWWRTERILRGTRASLRATQRSLAERQAESDAWQRGAQQAVAGFRRAIEDQFAVWKLTPAEGEVAMHLLRGEGHKQIAAATGRSERTVRQHAVAVYQKAGMGGRAELSAFFLQGLPESPARR
jgi:DNA-binding CsgD family transcriptional regulator